MESKHGSIGGIAFLFNLGKFMGILFMNKPTYNIEYDARWEGSHGIGRFSREIKERINFEEIFVEAAGKSLAKKAFFSPGYRPPLFINKPFVFTIHDLNHIDLKFNSSLLKRLYYRIFIKKGVKECYRVLTVSRFSKSRIVEWFGCDPEKVIVVGNGVNEFFFRNRISIKRDKPFFLCVSNRKGHKNEKALVRSFCISQLSHSHELWFTGSPSVELEGLIHEQGLTDSVGFTGMLSEDHLAAWYKGALALVFPSLYEGFGLPVIESMASGTPVITSNTTSLPEVGGNAALYVDPTSHEQISDAMIRVSSDGLLRQKMREMGLKQASKFSWDTTARKVEDVLKEMVSR